MNALLDRLHPDDAAELLAGLGFLFVPAVPDRGLPAYLLVAIRDHPTLDHYDPESLEAWTDRDGRGIRLVVDRSTAAPWDGEVSWGPERIIDRVGAANLFLGFGGTLRVEARPGWKVALLSSPVPLLQCGGHSQGWDVGALELDAFFARLRAAASDRTIEARLAGAMPQVRYAAFIVDLFERYGSSDSLRSLDPRLWSWVRDEERRLCRDEPVAVAAACGMLEQMR